MLFFYFSGGRLISIKDRGPPNAVLFTWLFIHILGSITGVRLGLYIKHILPIALTTNHEPVMLDSCST